MILIWEDLSTLEDTLKATAIILYKQLQINHTELIFEKYI